MRVTYPCDYPVKVIGDAAPRFEERVVATALRHDPTLSSARISSRDSRSGNFRSVTLLLTAEGEGQIRSLFADLKQLEFVRLVL